MIRNRGVHEHLEGGMNTPIGYQKNRARKLFY